MGRLGAGTDLGLIYSSSSGFAYSRLRNKACPKLHCQLELSMPLGPDPAGGGLVSWHWSCLKHETIQMALLGGL